MVNSTEINELLLAPRLLTFDEDMNDYRKRFRAFVLENIKPKLSLWELKGKVDKECFQKAAQLGFYCQNIPKTFGGAGLTDFRYNVIVAEELEAADCGSVFLPLGSDIVLPYFTHIATPEQQARWLPQIAKGAIIAVCMSEPHAGSDLQAIDTTATMISKPEDPERKWTLNGSKMWISNGAVADLYVVVAYTNRSLAHRGLSLFVVDRKSPGFSVVKTFRKLGRHAQDTAIISLKDVVVTEANLLGTLDGGFKHLMSNLPQERISIAVAALAASKRTLFLTMQHLKGRTLFNRQLADFQHSSFEMAEMIGEVNMLQTLVDTALNLHLEKKCSTELASLAKYRSSQAAFQIADRCLQLFGGYGYLRNSPVGRAFVDARVTMIYGGSNEVMKEIIARKFGFERSKIHSHSVSSSFLGSAAPPQPQVTTKPTPISSKV